MGDKGKSVGKKGGGTDISFTVEGHLFVGCGKRGRRKAKGKMWG